MADKDHLETFLKKTLSNSVPPPLKMKKKISSRLLALGLLKDSNLLQFFIWGGSFIILIGGIILFQLISEKSENNVPENKNISVKENPFTTKSQSETTKISHINKSTNSTSSVSRSKETSPSVKKSSTPDPVTNASTYENENKNYTSPKTVNDNFYKNKSNDLKMNPSSSNKNDRTLNADSRLNSKNNSTQEKLNSENSYNPSLPLASYKSDQADNKQKDNISHENEVANKPTSNNKNQNNNSDNKIKNNHLEEIITSSENSTPVQTENENFRSDSLAKINSPENYGSDKIAANVETSGSDLGQIVTEENNALINESDIPITKPADTIFDANLNQTSFDSLAVAMNDEKLRADSLGADSAKSAQAEDSLKQNLTKFSISFFGGIQWSFISIKPGTHTTSEQNLSECSEFNFGFLLTKIIKRWSISTGLNYSHLESSYRTTYIHHIDTMQFELPVKIKSEFSLYEIQPILIGYALNSGKFNYNIYSGVSLALISDPKASIVNEISRTELVALSKKDFKKSYWNFIAALSLGYSVNNKTELFLQPVIRLGLNGISNNVYIPDEKINNLIVRAGVKINF